MSVRVDICEIFIPSIGLRPGDKEMEEQIFSAEVMSTAQLLEAVSHIY